MATGTAGTTARDYNKQLVHYLRRGFTYANATQVLTVGVIPAGACVLRGGVVVKEAFNAGTNNRLDIGTSADDDGFATDLALTTIGVIVADEMATTDDMNPSADTTITATVDVTGTAATAGIGEVWIEYILDNDG